MSTFPQPCPDYGTPSLAPVYQGIQANTNDINLVMRALVSHVNDEMNNNQLDLDACSRKIKRHISSEISLSKRELTRLADQLMEVILHGVADVAIAGDAAIRGVDSTLPMVPEGLPPLEPPTVSDEPSTIGLPGDTGPGGDSERDSEARHGMPVREVSRNTRVESLHHAQVEVVRVERADGSVMTEIHLHITVLPAPVTVVSGQQQTQPPPVEDLIQGLSGGRGNGEGFSMGIDAKQFDNVALQDEPVTIDVEPPDTYDDTGDE